MRHLSVSVLLLLTSAIAFAQTSSNPPAFPLQNPPTTTFTGGQALPTMGKYVFTSNFGCPVNFYASHQANPQFASVNNNRTTPAGPSQGLHLTLGQPGIPDIQSIEVTVYGTSLKPQTLLLGGSPDGIITKTFTLERQAGNSSLTEADVWMQQVGSLRWADLISITYANGTTWHASENVKCRATPSNLLLVGQK